MAERVIVTGGDAGYFPLIDDLCASVRAFRSADQIGLAVIDGGLEPEQKRRLSARYDARILDFDWGYEAARRKAAGRDYLKGQVGRMFLDRMLPEAETIAWIDGDAWVQDFGPVEAMFEAAERNARLVIVSQASRYATHTMRVRWWAFGHAEVRSILYKNARRARVPEGEARRIGDKGTLNAGVFVLRRDAPHWEAVRRRQEAVLRHGRLFTSDQLALGLAVYVDGLPVELAPEICNYMGPWTCGADERTLVERFLPYAPVAVVHMAGFNDMRRDPAVTTEVLTLDGRLIQRSLRRSAWAA